jgi:hypothetical protein
LQKFIQKSEASLRRYWNCDDKFAVRPGEKYKSPIKAMLLRHAFDEGHGVILCKDYTKAALFSAKLVAGWKKHRPGAFRVSHTPQRGKVQAN